MELTNFVFKPKNLEITKMVIHSFVNEFLGWDDNGISIDWTDRDMPHGYIKLYAESEGVATEYFTECCLSDEPVTSRHLTEGMMITLDEEGFFDAPWLNERKHPDLPDGRPSEGDGRVSGLGTDDPKYFSFEDIELSEVISALSQNDSQILSFYSDRVFIIDKKEDGTSDFKSISLIKEVMKLSQMAIK